LHWNVKGRSYVMRLELFATLNDLINDRPVDEMSYIIEAHHVRPIFTFHLGAFTWDTTYTK